MAHTQDTRNRVRALDTVRSTLEHDYVGRGELVRLLELAILCREHVLLIGPAGTAKTDIVNRFTGMLGSARIFHALLTRFTEPAELFGPLDIGLLTSGRRYHIHTDGMLPHADVAFLDEIFQASAAILNALHTLLNERVFLNGSDREAVPLLSLVGAANTLPEEPGLAPFADRFLLRLSVRPVAGTRLHELLDAGDRRERERDNGSVPIPLLSLSDIQALHRSLAEVRLGDVNDLYEDVMRDLLALGVTLSDRRIVRSKRLIAGAALLDGSDRAGPRHFWPLYHIWSEPTDAETIRKRIDDVVLGGAASQPAFTRSVEEIVAVARNIVHENAERAPGALGTGAALSRLNRLRHELRRGHPDAAQAEADLANLIQELFDRLDNEE